MGRVDLERRCVSLSKLWSFILWSRSIRLPFTSFSPASPFRARATFNRIDSYLIANTPVQQQGISLTIPQYEALIAAVPEINKLLGLSGEDAGVEEDEVDNGQKRKTKTKVKIEKSNIEETSDEEGDE